MALVNFLCGWLEGLQEVGIIIVSLVHSGLPVLSVPPAIFVLVSLNNSYEFFVILNNCDFLLQILPLTLFCFNHSYDATCLYVLIFSNFSASFPDCDFGLHQACAVFLPLFNQNL